MRIMDINENAIVHTYETFLGEDTIDLFDFSSYDYVVDAVDTVTAKIELVLQSQKKGVPIISSMGAGNKLDGSMFQVADIYKTRVCPLAKVMRRELKKRGVKKLKVVYSEEQPVRPLEDMSISCRTQCICPPGAQHKCTERRDIPGSVAFVPSVAGLIIAGEVVKVNGEKYNDIVGKRVAVFPLIPCGKCKQCKNKLYEMCENYDYIGSRRNGAFAEYVEVPVWNLIELGDNIPCLLYTSPSPRDCS